jgi:hypothetical protein
MNETGKLGEMSKSEPALLRSLEKALHQVTPSHLPKEGVSFSEWARQFTYEYGPLIEQIAEFQLRTQFDPEIQALGATGSEVSTVGPDGKIDPRVLGVVERITQNPHFAALSQASASYGVRGIGLLTLNLEVAYKLGIQVGGELVLMHQYTVGDYTVPSELIGRAWYQVTAGTDVGYSGTFVPFPLDLSCWFTAPVSTKHLMSVYLTYVPLSKVYPVGLRLEIFGWLPEDSAPAIDPTKVIDHIHGFRLVVEAGNHKGAGAGVLGQQVATSGGLQLASLSITPNNLQPGPKYTLNGTVSAPHSGGKPNRILRSNTTLNLAFPKWVFSASQLPVAFTNDGTGKTTGWKATSTLGDGDDPSVFGFTWVGNDNTAWTQNMTFSVGASSSDVAPQDGNVACTLDNLDSADSDVERSLSGAQMTLSQLVLTAVGSYDLKVDPRWNSIENQLPGTTEMTGSVDATTANSASNKDNDFYPIVDPLDKTQCLTIDDTKGNSWWCGYQYRQTTDSGNVCAQYRAVFWRTTSSAADFNYFPGLWQTLINDNPTHSIACWSNGASTAGTTLDIYLKPSS